MRKTIIAGNWKMNGNSSSNILLIDAIKSGLSVTNAEVIVFPPSIYLSQIKEATVDSDIKVGAQNININRSGAFTGEISADMVVDIGCTHAILGHSERRNLYSETNDVVVNKIKTALNCELIPILCIGEELADREAGRTKDVLKKQISVVVDSLGIESFKNIIIAYEPVWAIGTGKTATPEQAQDAHKFVRDLLREHNKNIANNISILYGGSMNAQNCSELLACEDIDGGLIGGASLKAEDFLTICRAVK